MSGDIEPATISTEVRWLYNCATAHFVVNKNIKTATAPATIWKWERCQWTADTVVTSTLRWIDRRATRFIIKKKIEILFQERHQHFKLFIQHIKLALYLHERPTPLKFKSNIVYRFVCPDVGKRYRNLFTRYSEHAIKKESAVLEHLNECSDIKFLITSLTLGIEKPNFRSIYTNFVNENTSVIDSSDNWSPLLYKEALDIKRLKPNLNNGLKASRELYLF